MLWHSILLLIGYFFDIYKVLMGYATDMYAITLIIHN